MAPGYIASVWSLPALSGMMLGVFPIEELLFGFGIAHIGLGGMSILPGITALELSVVQVSIRQLL